MQIYKGELAVVIGKIGNFFVWGFLIKFSIIVSYFFLLGSGKSAFLNAILNELDGSSDNSRESLIFEENG